jgi:uncharacterized membrane protein
MAAMSLSFMLALAPALYAAPPTYNIVALNVLPGGLDSIGFGLNDSGEIVGESTLNRSGNVGQSRPVVWDYNGTPSELFSSQLIGASLQGINNTGKIVGRYGSGSFIPLPGSGVPYGRAFYWSAGTGMLGFGFDGNSEAVAINSSGQVAGTAERQEVLDFGNGPQPINIPHAFIWDVTNGIHAIGDLPGSNGDSFANGIDNHGQVALPKKSDLHTILCDSNT